MYVYVNSHDPCDSHCASFEQATALMIICRSDWPATRSLGLWPRFLWLVVKPPLWKYMVNIWIIYGWSILIWLVVGFNSSEKYEFVNWDDEIRNIWKNKKCSKPPTSYAYLNTSLLSETGVLCGFKICTIFTTSQLWYRKLWTRLTKAIGGSYIQLWPNDREAGLAIHIISHLKFLTKIDINNINISDK